MQARLLFMLGAAIALLGCESPQVVDCTTAGRFVEAGGEPFCVYPREATLRCPRLLPVRHELPWGGRACAAEELDPLPRELCVAIGPCRDDAGTDGGGT